jgi:hypothetical protein
VWLLQLEVTAVSNACKLGEQIQIAAELELLSMTMHERREHSSGDEIGKKKKSVCRFGSSIPFGIIMSRLGVTTSV